MNLTDIKAQKIKIWLAEESDSMGPDGINELTIETEDSGAGPYFVLKTARWAFDKTQEFTEVLQRFEKICRDNMEFTEKEDL